MHIFLNRKDVNVYFILLGTFILYYNHNTLKKFQLTKKTMMLYQSNVKGSFLTQLGLYDD